MTHTLEGCTVEQGPRGGSMESRNPSQVGGLWLYVEVCPEGHRPL